MKNYAMGNPNPEAYVTKGKQRIKQLNGNVYLNDGDNFEVELFNPTSNHILAQITMNGKSISNAGIVLRPGERVFLERHIDSNNKFVFSTYEVNGNNEQVKKAIAYNGIVKVEFFDERLFINLRGTVTNTWISNPWVITTPNVTPNIFYTSNTNSISTSGVQSFGDDFKSNSVISGNLSYSADMTFMDTSNNGELPKSFPPTKNCATRKIETGTIEKGDTSKQKFSTSERDFHYISFHNVEWHILPKSQQPVSSKDINKVYCTECGTKILKSTFKFCPNCGTKIE
jgi:hypothetical protein